MLVAGNDVVTAPPPPRRALILDDEADFAASLSDILEDAGYLTCVINSVDDVVEDLADFNADVTLVDVRLRDASGIDAIEALQALWPHSEAIVMTGYATVENAIAAIHKGAYDYLRKPFHAEELKAVLNRCFEKIELRRDKRAANEKLRTALDRAELANRAKSEFLANMSHEVRTPLNVILGYSEVIKDQHFGPLHPEKYVEYAKDIHESGAFVLSLVNDVLDMAAIESGQSEIKESSVEIEAIVDFCFRMLKGRAESFKLKLMKEIAQGIPDLRADERMVKQMLLNLLSNAVKFTPEGGRIGVVVTLADDGDLVIAVADNGVGIAEEDQQKILEPFTVGEDALTRSADGAGLGLALTKSMMEMHDGTLELRSNIDVGTVVTLRFPKSRLEN
ncbi:MAG: response regulator [Rhodospirillaceae bacterium]|jgi:signal transduction histidine kinase|nr:response regulator [Rhodospirillaceae bacterium]